MQSKQDTTLYLLLIPLFQRLLPGMLPKIDLGQKLLGCNQELVGHVVEGVSQLLLAKGKLSNGPNFSVLFFS